MVSAALLLLFAAVCSRNNDAELQKAISEAIAGVGITGVTVVVNDGVAAISGEVPDDAARDRVLTAIRSAAPKSVIDNLTVRPPGPTRFETNPELKKQIVEALKMAGCGGADVSSNAKSVFLVGEVIEEKYVECIRVANRAAGEKVENNLRVRN